MRSEEYRARRWQLKRKRRQRRDPDGRKGVYTAEDAGALAASHERCASCGELYVPTAGALVGICDTCQEPAVGSAGAPK